jgi:hypothetical protein
MDALQVSHVPADPMEESIPLMMVVVMLLLFECE